jgi:hypothetical protein
MTLIKKLTGSKGGSDKILFVQYPPLGVNFEGLVKEFIANSA